jgi:hypothetical protein
MRAISTILLAGALTLMSAAAFGQIRIGGHGDAKTFSGNERGGPPPAAGNKSGRFNGANGGHRGGVRLGGSGRSIGIGSSRVNSAISSQGRGKGGGRFR